MFTEERLLEWKRQKRLCVGLNLIWVGVLLTLRGVGFVPEEGGVGELSI